MKIIVCGAGQVGLQIAKHLSDERMDVIVIDKSSDLIKKVVDELDVSAVCGYASYPNVLERAGAHDADMIMQLLCLMKLIWLHAKLHILYFLSREKLQNQIKFLS